MSIEDRKADNDNLTRAELDAQRLQRENKLREYKLFTDTVRKWLNTRFNEIKPENSPAMTEAQRILIKDTIEGIRELLVTTEWHILLAEEHIDDMKAYKRAESSRDSLYATYVEAEFNL